MTPFRAAAALLGPCPRARAFSIVELLVVISIIALLISMLLPSLSQAREKARHVRWKGLAHSMQTDPRNCLYWDFEDQGAEVKTHKTPSGATGSHNYVRNKAANDPFLTSKFDFAMHDYDGVFGHDDLAKSPEWSTRETRWKGKGGALFATSAAQQHIATSKFTGGESAEGDRTLREFSVSFWGRFFITTNWNEQIALRTDNPGATGWGNFVYHSTTTQAMYMGTACCGGNTRFEPTDACCASGVTPLDQFNMVTYTRYADGSASAYVNGGTATGGKESHKPNPTVGVSNPGGVKNNIMSLFVGVSGGSFSWDGVLDELAVWTRELDTQTVNQMYQVGASRRRQ